MECAGNITKEGKYRQVCRTWVEKALDGNFPDLQMDKLPTPDEMRAFAESMGSKADMQSLSRKKRPKRKRGRIMFHSDDRRKDEKEYLFFPIGLADLEVITARKAHAYCRALQLKFKGGKQKDVLRRYLQEGSAVHRPPNPPTGSWNDWVCEVGS